MNNSNPFSVEGLVIVITGGLGFLGRQFGKALARAGAIICVLDKKSGGEFESFMNEIDECGNKGKHTFHCCDIRLLHEVSGTVAWITRKHERIDVLINCAAMNPAVGSPEAERQFASYDAYPDELWNEEIETNLTGTQRCIKAVAKHMMQERRGSIINIASELSLIAYDHRIYGPTGKHKSVAYIASKTGVIGLTRAWAEFFGEYGVRVNALSPGGMQTDKQSDEFVRSYSAHNMLGRMAQIGEYNGVIQFLCSEASSFMTGHNLVIDGGKTAW